MNDTSRTPAVAEGDTNPFFEHWSGPFGVPPFARIRPEHFLPAYDRAFSDHLAEIEAIAANPADPTFDNTIVSLENSGRALRRVDDVFGHLVGTDSTDTLLEIERDTSPRVAAHWAKIRTNAALFARIDALHSRRDALGLTAEQARVLERYHTTHRRNGAALDAKSRQRLAQITERLATLGTAFSQNVLADEQSYMMILDSEADLGGLPDFVREAALAAGEERGHKGKHVITLQRSSVEPFLQFSSRRDLREKAFRAWQSRGDNNDKSDNKAIIAETVALRAERARLMGYATYAHYRLDDAMAKTPDNVRKLLETVWAPARVRALADRDAMQEIVREEGGNFALAPWDWRHYAEKLRKRRCDIDEATVKPYMQLDNVIEAAFHAANRLFGLSFARTDVPVWHPDVRAWEVKDAAGAHVGLFFGDYYARPSKQSGAWMSTLRDQEKLFGNVRPLVYNVMNFNKGNPTLLSFDDARTLFHEFGHGLHGLLSNVTYPQIACTNVLTDWVELPSQLYEHWFEQPEILRQFARHFETGEPMPEDLMKRLIAARTFNRGADTLEYISSAMVDLDLHLLEKTDGLDVNAFEKATLERIGMPAELGMRHRTPHFGHVFSGGYYASAYYSYMWSETLDSDAFAAFEETGDIFDQATANKLKEFVLSAGGSRDPAELYVAFRGRLPDAQALLKRRGFLDAA
jgi:peptidyl-dipeptidase Dcp